MRSSLEEPSQKRAFLEQYVAEELIHQKAKRLELDKDPSVRKQAERAMRQIMIQKVLEDEIKTKVKISEDEMNLYYRAHADRYGEKEAFKVRMMRVDTDQIQGILRALETGEAFAELAKRHSLDEATRSKGGEVGDWIEEGLDPTGMGDPNRLWLALENHGEGDVTEPVGIDGEYYLFQIISHRPARPFSFEEAKKAGLKDK